MKADKILAALEQRHVGEEWAFFRELRTNRGYSAYGYVDALVVGLWAKNRNVIAYEVKVSRGDFMHDIEQFQTKQKAALKYSSLFYYAVPWNLVQPNEVPEKAGLMWINTAGGVVTKKQAPLREPDFDMQFVAALAYRTRDKVASNPLTLKYCDKDFTEEEIEKVIEQRLQKKMQSVIRWKVQREVSEKLREERQKRNELERRLSSLSMATSQYDRQIKALRAAADLLENAKKGGE